MTKRELAYLLVGLGAGLLLSVALVIEFALLFHHMFIIGFAWRPASVIFALPFLMILVGLVLLFRNKTEP